MYLTEWRNNDCPWHMARADPGSFRAIKLCVRRKLVSLDATRRKEIRNYVMNEEPKICRAERTQFPIFGPDSFARD